LVLSMAMLPAIRRHLGIDAFYHRLRQAGKPEQAAIAAAMQKLLTVLKAILRHQCLWNPAVHISKT